MKSSDVMRCCAGSVSYRSRSTVDHIDHVFAVMRCAAYVSYVVP